ncbi:hypothetical protein K3556_14530 [Aliiroseovarius sp. M344]|uniref:hypothetical protein n=1 Tax=Aliiroseovarius sp. M344 TaxID=2867010 RepID=UPI0021AE1028|nr:hypothetical protein [Aliiroseovarius sp. M344]UWQ14107.1 hypothetical protein K3556_14530 [Aliiroseovarius sp. M344]
MAQVADSSPQDMLGFSVRPHSSASQYWGALPGAHAHHLSRKNRFHDMRVRDVRQVSCAMARSVNTLPINSFLAIRASTASSQRRFSSTTHQKPPRKFLLVRWFYPNVHKDGWGNHRDDCAVKNSLMRINRQGCKSGITA